MGIPYNLEWNVIRYNINQKKIEYWNVFDHYSFCTETIKYLFQMDNKSDFSEKLRSEAMYYFWSKAEYEIVIIPWVGDKSVSVKIDTYFQLQINWNKFIDYLWGVKQLREKKYEP